jgi:hypothetical protein
LPLSCDAGEAEQLEQEARAAGMEAKKLEAEAATAAEAGQGGGAGTGGASGGFSWSYDSSCPQMPRN